MFIVFRASGAAFDPQQFVAAHRLDSCSFWLREKPSRDGKTATQTSGFRLSLADVGTGAEAIPLIREFIEDGKHWLDALKEQSVHCEIDIGMVVGGETAFTASVTLDPSFLGELAGRQIALVCSAYPSDD
jgi:hypothetical protein